VTGVTARVRETFFNESPSDAPFHILNKSPSISPSNIPSGSDNARDMANLNSQRYVLLPHDHLSLFAREDRIFNIVVSYPDCGLVMTQHDRKRKDSSYCSRALSSIKRIKRVVATVGYM
jgi:hypothetical protein